jgi:hypothetical protein
MSEERLWKFQRPEWLNSAYVRSAGVYTAGGLVRFCSCSRLFPNPYHCHSHDLESLVLHFLPPKPFGPQPSTLQIGTEDSEAMRGRMSADRKGV